MVWFDPTDPMVNPQVFIVDVEHPRVHMIRIRSSDTRPEVSGCVVTLLLSAVSLDER